MKRKQDKGMTQQFLLKEEPLRLGNGRFCTIEQLRIEQVDSENLRLRLERDKYRRAWLASSSKASRLERELVELKERIGGLL